jgi:2-succinyl-6-hydroxy-2,4-cyclohexadiene-1-carboxylate synthase
MIYTYKNLQLNIELFSEFKSEKKSILFLHGFTGSAKDWKDVAQKINPAFNKIALDSIGHGKSESPVNIKLYKSDELVKQIFFVLDHLKIERVIICGYSMGGRTALNFAAAHPEKILALILESTSAGIENKTERRARVKHDKELADFIESHSIEEFVNSWLHRELFSSLRKLPENKFRKLKNSKMHNSKTGLLNSLRGFGTGVMPYLGKDIQMMNFPVLLITGALDEKFTRINKELANQFLDAEHKIIDDAGHNVHFENPEMFAETLIRFLKQF